MEDMYLEIDRRHSYERGKYLKLVVDSVKNDSEFIYTMLCDRVAKRFEIDNYASCISDIIKHYVENVDMDFNEWLYCDDAPLIVPLHKIVGLFPEFANLGKSKYEIVNIANKMYGLDMHIDYDCCGDSYVYAYSFNFNSFTPICVDDVSDIKKEIEFCEKYGIDHKELDEKIGKLMELI